MRGGQISEECGIAVAQPFTQRFEQPDGGWPSLLGQRQVGGERKRIGMAGVLSKKT